MGTNTTLSRRKFLAAAGLGTAALVTGCTSGVISAPPLHGPVNSPPSPIPSTSPYLPGGLKVYQAILGQTFGLPAMPQPLTPGQFNIPADAYAKFPAFVQAAVYSPFNLSSGTPNPGNKSVRRTTSEPYPILLYAHAYRGDPALPGPVDITTVGAMMVHVATYGCVCVVPDLSWLVDGWVDVGSQQAGPPTFEERAAVLVAYYHFLVAMNRSMFGNRLDPSRVILVGHSTGAGGAVHAGRDYFSSSPEVTSLSYGLIAPEYGGDLGGDIHRLLSMVGSLDTYQGASQLGVYSLGGSPKTQVIIPGANHFGYTDLCPADNSCGTAGLFDANGTISVAAQQATGGAYLAALVRWYALGDATAGPYLSGQKQVEGLASLGVTGIQVTADFLLGPPPLVPTPARPTVVTHA